MHTETSYHNFYFRSIPILPTEFYTSVAYPYFLPHFTFRMHTNTFWHILYVWSILILPTKFFHFRGTPILPTTFYIYRRILTLPANIHYFRRIPILPTIFYIFSENRYFLQHFIFPTLFDASYHILYLQRIPKLPLNFVCPTHTDTS